MALYAIGDLHLSLGTNKPMDVFGGKWNRYVEKIREGFRGLESGDICVICGDVSWGMSLEESLEDFRFIDELPGRKLILKGNHDYWWNTQTKLKIFFERNGIGTIEILHNNSYEYGGYGICGTRGWFYEEERGDEHDRKIMKRELQRMEMSLKAAGEREKLCFLHYPPLYNNYRCAEIIELLQRYGVGRCYYGHIHGTAHKYAIEGESEGIEYRMVSADWLDFKPVLIEG